MGVVRGWREEVGGVGVLMIEQMVGHYFSSDLENLCIINLY